MTSLRKYLAFAVVLLATLVATGVPPVERAEALDQKIITLTLNSYDESARKLFYSMNPQPDNARKRLYNNLIKGLKYDNIWSKIDVLQIYAAHSAQASLLNIKAPTGIFTATTSGSPTFTVDRGYTTSATGPKYVDSGWNFASTQIGVSQNSTHLSIWSRTSGMSGVFVGAEAGSASLWANTDGTFIRINQNSTQENIPTGDTLGYFIWNRSGANAVQVYKNNATVGSGTTASEGGPSAANVYVGSRNVSGVASNTVDGEISVFSVGLSLTSFEAMKLNAHIAAYMKGVGAP